MPTRIRRHQRGAAALAVTVLLLFVMALAVGLAHRNLIFEQRSSANQLRSTRAFEAAEAGLAWAQTLLDRGGAIGADCSAADAVPGDTSFRDRYLAFDAASGTLVPR
ncbi:MAG: fimbrial assembly protein, partial [Piscinibacter sp.]|nr:fimbrial assembly protein [Piscinibacter sp.]